MFAADRKVLARIEPAIRRVVIVDPNPAPARLLMDIMKGLGAREVITETTEERGLEAIAEAEPGLVFTERTGEFLNGESFTRRLRRSTMASRRVPVIMVTAEATATSIKGARDCGVHEFLRKPFTSSDLFRRVENVSLKSRDWIEAVGYVGPDRRRFNSGDYQGVAKRKADQKAEGAATASSIKDQAMRILASSLAQFDSDPTQAVRAIRQQGDTLKALAIKTSDAALAMAAANLQAAMAQGPSSKASLAQPVGAVIALADPETFAKAS